MCANHDHDSDEHAAGAPNPSEFLANLRQPGPLGWKVRRVLVNNFIKISRRQHCCGNLGEPGC